MPRLILILLAVALTVFAVADWAARSRTWTPGRLNRWLWLAVILFLPIVGPLAWIIIGAVTRAEAAQAEGSDDEPKAPTRPDDNPEAVSDVAERIARRSRRTRPAPPRSEPAGGPEEVAGEDRKDDPKDEDPASRGDAGSERP